jgi:predicted permease
MSLWSRLGNVFCPGNVQRDLDEELQFHLEERIRELMAEGMTRAEAAAAAERRLGSRLRHREASLDVKLVPWLDSIRRDISLGVRVLRKHALVTGAAILSLALALGGCVAAFSLVDALILRPLPVRQPNELVYLSFPTFSADRPEADTFNDPTLVRLREAGRGKVDLVAMSTQVMRPVFFNGTAGEKERVRTQFASGGAFDLLGVAPAAGRLFTRQDDVTPGAHPVAIISHAFWQRRFGGDAAVVGRTFALEDRPFVTRQFQIVGVAERTFFGIEPGRPTDVWLPYAMYNPRAFDNFDFNWFRIVGRLKPGVSGDQVQPALQTAFSAVRRDRADFGPNQPPDQLARYLSAPLYVRSGTNGASPLRRQFERPLWILAAIAGLVLLIAGSNVANLFLARVAAREREMSLRLSIGASRARLIQQVLIESAIVAIAACLGALLFAGVVAPAVVAMLASAEDPVFLDLRVDWRLLAFVGSLTLLSTVLFGLASALRASHAVLMPALKDGGERSVRGARALRPFAAIQIAFSLVVLIAGSLLMLSFSRLSAVNPGFNSANVWSLSLETTARVDPAEQRLAFFGVLDRLRGMAGIDAAGASEFGLLGRAWTHYVRLPETAHDSIEVTMAPVTPGFFDTMRIPIVDGRDFSMQDMTANGTERVIVNEAFAKKYFGRDRAVGRTVDARFAENSLTLHELIGVVADTRYDLREPAAPTVYIPLRSGSIGAVHVRVSGGSNAVVSRLRDEVRAASPLFRVTSLTPKAVEIDGTLLRERMLALLAGFFALVGLALAAVGLYGVLSYSVVQRRREIGIRLALGGSPVGVVRAVLTDAGGAALAGIAFGLAGGLYLSRFLEALVFEVRALDFWSLTLPLGTLLLAAMLAAAGPAIRAAHVDPAAVLREE